MLARIEVKPAVAGDMCNALTANRALSAIEARERGGESLRPEFVQLKLDRQSALAEAEGREAAASAGYNAAIARLERTKGTLLRYNNVIMAEEPATIPPRVGRYGEDGR